jgi:hypothetical protein
LVLKPLRVCFVFRALLKSGRIMRDSGMRKEQWMDAFCMLRNFLVVGL